MDCFKKIEQVSFLKKRLLLGLDLRYSELKLMKTNENQVQAYYSIVWSS